MSEICNLDAFANGDPGALARMTQGLAACGIPFDRQDHWREHHTARLSGTIPGLDAYRAAMETPSDWVSGSLILPETTLTGRHGLPYVHALDSFVLGDALNKRVANTAIPDHVDPAGATRLDTAFFIGGRGGATYGHWLLDFVPQVLTARDTARRTGITGPFLVVNHTPFGKRLLKYIGIADDCVFARRDEAFHVDRLVMPLITKLKRRYAIDCLRRGYAHMLACGGAEGHAAARGAGMRKLLIARRRAPVCANFDAVRAALTARGFDVLFPEDDPFSKQFNLFREADVVVGEDGSAMHNAGFCRPGTPLIVWSRADKVNWWHGQVSLAADLPLHYLQSHLRDDGGYDAPLDDILALV